MDFKRFTSRKFLLSLLGAFIVIGNEVFKWEFEAQQINQVLAILSTFILTEGAVDVSRNTSAMPGVEAGIAKEGGEV